MNEGWKCLSQKALESLRNKYAAERDAIEVSIKIALNDPRSIPDHFDFVEDLGVFVEKAERLDSLVSYTDDLIKKVCE